MNVTYRGPSDLPEAIPVFPLPGALLLPRGIEHGSASISQVKYRIGKFGGSGPAVECWRVSDLHTNM